MRASRPVHGKGSSATSRVRTHSFALGARHAGAHTTALVQEVRSASSNQPKGKGSYKGYNKGWGKGGKAQRWTPYAHSDPYGASKYVAHSSLCIVSDASQGPCSQGEEL